MFGDAEGEDSESGGWLKLQLAESSVLVVGRYEADALTLAAGRCSRKVQNSSVQPKL